MIKAFLCLYVLLNLESVVKPSNLASIPFDVVQPAVHLVGSQKLEVEGLVGQAILLICGIQAGYETGSDYMLLPWCPFRDEPTAIKEPGRLIGKALNWVVDQTGLAVMKLHDLTRTLWSSQWRRLCNFYAVTGRCENRGTGRCAGRHEIVTLTSHSEFLDDLISINSAICALTPLYYRRIMPETIQIWFLGARRSWLEKLLVALTFVSGHLQDASVLAMKARRIQHEQSLCWITSSLESLLFYRLGHEWESRSNFSALMDQLSTARCLGSDVEKCLYRSMLYKARVSRHATQSGLEALVDLERLMKDTDSRNFSGRVITYLEWLTTLTSEHFDSFHAHTGHFELIVMYLTLRIRPAAMIFPRAWIELHLPRLLALTTFSSASDSGDLDRFTLLMVLKNYLELLEWLNDNIPTGYRFITGGDSYSVRTLQQRNAEVVALLIVNYVACVPTGTTQGTLPTAFIAQWKRACRLFSLPQMGVKHLEHRIHEVQDLQKKLVSSHRKYGDKNPLSIVTNSTIEPHKFSALQDAFGVSCVTLDSLHHRFHSPQFSSVQHLASATSHEPTDFAVAKAVRFIQRQWRKIVPYIRAKNVYARSEEGQIAAKIQILGVAANVHLPRTVINMGIQVLQHVASLASSVFDLKKRALNLIETAEQGRADALDEVLETMSTLGVAIKTNQHRVGDESLKQLLRKEGIDGLEVELKSELHQLEKDRVQVECLRKIVDRIRGT